MAAAAAAAASDEEEIEEGKIGGTTSTGRTAVLVGYGVAVDPTNGNLAVVYYDTVDDPGRHQVRIAQEVGDKLVIDRLGIPARRRGNCCRIPAS